MTHLPYATCRALKEAGFPQDIGQVVHVNIGSPNDGVYVVPSLSELISGLKGDKPNSFYLEFNDEWTVYEDPNAKGMWKCRYYDRTPVGFYESWGDTPEAAVASLYLSIHGKENV
jgi:hypothetical protein